MDPQKRDFYSSIADQFDDLVHPYDQLRRQEIIFRQLLPESGFMGLLVLDDGCGTGAIALEAQRLGGRVVGCDISCAQLRQAQCKGLARGTVADALHLPFPNDCFDLVLSSEMIEHTMDPGLAVEEMARVLHPGGRLVLTCPNRVWKWLVDLATYIRIRPFRGLENFPSFRQLDRFVQRANLKVESHTGFHPWPFQIPLRDISRSVDYRFGGTGWKRFMVNQALVAVKQAHGDG